jgi:hypothetical protein
MNNPAPAEKRKPGWKILIPAVVLLAVIAVAIYFARTPAKTSRSASGFVMGPSTPAAPNGPATSDLPPAALSNPPATPAPADSAPAPGRGPAVGRLGVDQASCPAFAEIAGRFWDLKQQGTTLDSAFIAIEQGSGGDQHKIKLLKALAQVVYANTTETRAQAAGNALDACHKQ